VPRPGRLLSEKVARRSGGCGTLFRRTPGHIRVVFGLGALGLTIQWFDRLGRVLAGGSAGWSLAWDVAAVGLLPLGAGYFAYRAASPGAGGPVRARHRTATPVPGVRSAPCGRGAVPSPRRGGGWV
jgi:hypothetical protein